MYPQAAKSAAMRSYAWALDFIFPHFRPNIQVFLRVPQAGSDNVAKGTLYVL
jgi:hypothetical protein